jgi:hypothetical protein
MVYASLEEVWGNSMVIENPNKNKANFESFHDDFRKNMREQSAMTRQKYNDSLLASDPRKSTFRKKPYFLTSDDSTSEISNPVSDVASNDTSFEFKKLKGKKINYIQKKDEFSKESKNSIKINDYNHSISSSPKKEHFNSTDCNSILEHLKTCEYCRNLIEYENKNIFIKEFIMFATSGVLMFIFLELLAKLVKK